MNDSYEAFAAAAHSTKSARDISLVNSLMQLHRRVPYSPPPPLDAFASEEKKIFTNCTAQKLPETTPYAIVYTHSDINNSHAGDREREREVCVTPYTQNAHSFGGGGHILTHTYIRTPDFSPAICVYNSLQSVYIRTFELTANI